MNGVCLWLFLFSSQLSNAEVPPPADDQTFERLKQEVRDSLQAEPRWYYFSRARVVHPQKVSLGLTALRTKQPPHYDCRTPCAFNGWMFSLEPGLGGSQLGAGYAWAKGETKQRDRWVRSVYVGYGVKGTLLRTNREAWTLKEPETYLGTEGVFTIVRVNFTFGVAYRLSDNGGDQWLYTGGIGWGF